MSEFMILTWKVLFSLDAALVFCSSLSFSTGKLTHALVESFVVSRKMILFIEFSGSIEFRECQEGATFHRANYLFDSGASYCKTILQTVASKFSMGPTRMTKFVVSCPSWSLRSKFGVDVFNECLYQQFFALGKFSDDNFCYLHRIVSSCEKSKAAIGELFPRNFLLSLLQQRV